MNIKRLLCGFLLASTLVGLTGALVIAAPLRIALITPSAVNDMAFSQGMYQGLLALQAEMGEDNLEIAYSEGMFIIGDAAVAIRDYASQGYNIIIAHGAQYGTSVGDVAPDFPNTMFTTDGGFISLFEDGITNLFFTDILAQEGGYVLGTLAAKLTESGVAGMIGPIQVGESLRYLAGFEEGFKAAAPDGTVNTIWTGSFSDVTLAAEAAEAHISSGADVLTGISQSMIGAIGATQKHGAYWFGSQADQTSVAPQIVAANMIYDWTGAVKEAIRLYQQGTMGSADIYYLALANGGIAIGVNDQALVGDVIQEILDGTITIDIDE